MIILGLIDFRRLENLNLHEFTISKSKNRIDYCLASIDFYDKFVRTSTHSLGTKLGDVDHAPVKFSASSHSPPPGVSLPFKCPTWLLKCEHVQAQLQCNLQHLAALFDPSKIPGYVLDEHKRRDRKFLCQEYLRRKDATASQLRHLLPLLRVIASHFFRWIQVIIIGFGVIVPSSLYELFDGASRAQRCFKV